MSLLHEIQMRPMRPWASAADIVVELFGARADPEFENKLRRTKINALSAPWSAERASGLADNPL